MESESIYVYICGSAAYVGMRARLFLSAHTHAGSGIECSCALFVGLRAAAMTNRCFPKGLLQSERDQRSLRLFCWFLPLSGPVFFGARISDASKTAVELDLCERQNLGRCMRNILCYMVFGVGLLSTVEMRPDAFWLER